MASDTAQIVPDFREVKIALRYPLRTIGKDELHSITCDFSAMRARDYTTAIQIGRRLCGGALDSSYRNGSPEFRIGLAWAAALHGTPGLCMDDIDNLSPADMEALDFAALDFLAGEQTAPGKECSESSPHSQGGLTPTCSP